MANILVFGATGFTGRQIVQELDRRGASYILAGRSEKRLVELSESLSRRPEIRVAHADKPTTVDAALEGIGLVINTVGPFTDLGETVVRSALSRGIHYIDTTGEQSFIYAMETRFHALAQQHNAVLCCALAFEYALGECAAAIACEALEGDIDLLETFYSTGKGGVSRGTAKSIMRAMTADMLAWESGRLIPEKMASTTSEITFNGEDRYRQAVSFGGGMPLHARHLGNVREARSFLVMNEDMIRGLKRYQPATRLLRIGPLQRVVDRVVDWKIPSSGPDTKETSFRVAARARKAGLETQVCVIGKDPYGITACLAAEGATRFMAGEQRQSGAYSVASLLNPRHILDALSDAGVSWSLVDGK
jgi:short subunit dehydrogenase-like uncharacterized protein